MDLRFNTISFYNLEIKVRETAESDIMRITVQYAQTGEAIQRKVTTSPNDQPPKKGNPSPSSILSPSLQLVNIGGPALNTNRTVTHDVRIIVYHGAVEE